MRILHQGRGLGCEAVAARGLFQRLAGLMGRKKIPRKSVMVFEHCAFIHTFFMKTPIDIVIAGKGGRVVKIYEKLRPWAVAGSAAGRVTFEFAPGAVKRYNIKEGDKLTAVER